MSSGYIDLPLEGGVNSLNTLTGALTLVAGPGIVITNLNSTDIQISSPGSGVVFPLIIPAGSVTAPSIAFSETGNDTGVYSTGDGNFSIAANGALALSIDAPGNVTVANDLTVTGNITAANFPQVFNQNHAVYADGTTGELVTWNELQRDSVSQSITQQTTQQPNGAGGWNVQTLNVQFDPLQNSPAAGYNINQISVDVDPNDTGFGIGTGGTFVILNNNFLSHNSPSDTGSITFINNVAELGNSTDPISIAALTYCSNFTHLYPNATITNQIQGFNFTINTDVGSSINDVNGLCDFSNIQGTIVGSYNSANLSPVIEEIQTNHNYVGLNMFTNIDNFAGNAGCVGIALSGNLGTFDTGGYQGISINPNITLVQYATGINVSMDSVTVYAGTPSSLVIQDLTLTFNAPGDNNSIQIEYLNDGTAGSETAVVAGLLLTVHMQSGVSTATQIKAALDANGTILTNLTTTISGVGSNPQVAQAATNFTGGTNPGNKKAAYLDGDVEITGNLTFGGALSIGILNSFASLDVATALPGVNSISMLITAPSLAASATVTGVDLLGINTAMLLTMGDNSTWTTSFLGATALGLPAVVSMGTGSTIDRVAGAAFAISLDSGATGGTIDEVDLCRALAIPNGATTITKLKAYQFDLPFGDPGTTTWGVYMEPACHNYMAGDLVVGGAPVSADTPANASVGIELNSTTKAILNARMTTTEKNALTAIAGMMVYDSTLNQLSYFNGTVWVNV